MTVPEREETWSISSGLQSSLIGIAILPPRPTDWTVSYGESSGEGADHVSAAAPCSHKK